jgi:luciferase family oxidoreductase group 1
MRKIPYSVLDLAWVPNNQSPQETLQQVPQFASAVENYGYHRYWVAEHHNTQGVACSATSLVLSFAGAATRRIRLGAGGVMLPNHAPLVVAEQFGTLEAFFPNRIDLGLGRAPGTDGKTVIALRRDPHHAADNFIDDVVELRSYFASDAFDKPIIASPAAGRELPLCILGSSTYGAQVAALLGLPYAFASHFAPQQLEEALLLYRRNFQPSVQLEKPYTKMVVNAFCAENEEQAKAHASVLAQAAYGLIRGKPGKLMPPNKDFLEQLTSTERQHIQQFTQYSAVGTPDQVHEQIQKIAEEFLVDEIMISAPYYDLDQRIKSFELISKDNPHMLNMNTTEQTA